MHHFPLIVTGAPLSSFQALRATHCTFDQEQGTLGLCGKPSDLDARKVAGGGIPSAPPAQKIMRFFSELEFVSEQFSELKFQLVIGQEEEEEEVNGSCKPALNKERDGCRG